MQFKFENQAEYSGEIPLSKEIRHERVIFKFGQMVQNMKDIGLMIRQIKKEN